MTLAAAAALELVGFSSAFRFEPLRGGEVWFGIAPDADGKIGGSWSSFSRAKRSPSGEVGI